MSPAAVLFICDMCKGAFSLAHLFTVHVQYSTRSCHLVTSYTVIFVTDSHKQELFYYSPNWCGILYVLRRRTIGAACVEKKKVWTVTSDILMVD